MATTLKTTNAGELDNTGRRKQLVAALAAADPDSPAAANARIALKGMLTADQLDLLNEGYKALNAAHNETMARSSRSSDATTATAARLQELLQALVTLREQGPYCDDPAALVRQTLKAVKV